MKKKRLILELVILAALALFLVFINLKDEINCSYNYYQNYNSEVYSKELKEIKKEIKSVLEIKYLKLGHESEEDISDNAELNDFYYIFIDCKDNNISYENAYKVIDKCSSYISEQSTKYQFLKNQTFKITIRLPSSNSNDELEEECTYIGKENKNKLCFKEIIFENVKKEFFSFNSSDSEYVKYVLGQPLYFPNEYYYNEYDFLLLFPNLKQFDVGNQTITKSQLEIIKGIVPKDCEVIGYNLSQN